MPRFILSLFLLTMYSAHADWQLSTPSSLTFTSTKNTHLVEVHRFTRLEGYVKHNGEAKLQIDLASIDSNIAIRDERMRDLLFKTTQFARAELTARIPEAIVQQAQNGQTVSYDLDGDLWLHGSRQPVSVPVTVVPTADGKVVISNSQPVLLHADAFGLTKGIQALRDIAGLETIGEVVPVHFTLTFAPSTQ
ncbi:MAG: YceI family protein [Bacterioplanes sp.]|nr:YceI family protein [Bacterioplanes sp.]